MASEESQLDLNYKNALDFLDNLPKFSYSGAQAYKPGLETSLKLSALFGNPEKKFKSIHIAGTNGKGSVAHLIASSLQEEGYKTALYTSPHIFDFRERMKINGSMIPKERVVEFVNKWKSFNSDLSPSFFELTMMMAFHWFAQESVDCAVIEVGMGGRLDSTNIIIPLLSVITNISNDHNQFLGNTLQEIAREKAGIIKPGVPVIIGKTQKETQDVFKVKASKEGSEINFADFIFSLPSPEHLSTSHTSSSNFRQQNLRLSKLPEGWLCNLNNISFTVPLSGDYQKENISTALAALKSLDNKGLKISDDAIAKGFEKVIENTGLYGRWAILSPSPFTIADAGHNEAALKSNLNQLKNLLNQTRGLSQSPTVPKLRMILGFMADKSIDSILSLMPKDAIYYVSDAHTPRALPAHELHNKLACEGLSVRNFPSFNDAFLMAKKDASNDDIIFIGGSFAVLNSICDPKD